MTTGIVLAAGMSTRMGALKQLLPLGDKAVIEVVVERVSSRLDKVLDVLGHRADERVPVLADYAVEWIVNTDYCAGMLSSVKCGIQAAGETTGYLICLGDQPSIDPRVIDQVQTAAIRLGKGIVIPTYGGRRGHPIFLAGAYAEKILALSPDQGLNLVTRGHPADTLEIPVDNKEILEDMDTPVDYQRERSRYHIEPG